MTVPIDPRKPGHEGPLKHFMESLHPYVAYLILPLFAFAAAGFSFQGLSLSTLANPVPLGIAMGLFIGGLAFDPNDTLAQTEVRMGVIAGSILSALVGMGVLAYAQRQRN